jgi:LuxR family maltose regulon positive regulatory protein
MKAAPLIRTKLQRPRLPRDLVRRSRLLDRLQEGAQRKLSLISAMTGTGKTTLLAQWLEECPQPSAWLSLDEYDNDRIEFLRYLCAAIRTVFPSACDDALSLLSASQSPPARVITTLIVNELHRLVADLPLEDGRLTTGLILALDDYHHITDPAVDEILSGLIEHLPLGVHLALVTRTDPPFPLAGLRARGEMTEVRSADLRFTLEEASAFLTGTTGSELNPETIRLLEDKTEGWIVGLRLAALSMRDLLQDQTFARRFNGTSSAVVVEYLTSEVLARQSPDVQAFVLRTSVLDRFCAPLCEALTEVPATRGQEIIDWIARANLFLVPLDEEGRWYRYHHLFLDLLRHELHQQYGTADIATLHARAGAWFARNELIDEALHHYLAGGDTQAAADLVARNRTERMNQARWSLLGWWIHQFAPDVLDQHPDLAMLKTWLLYHQTRYAELPEALKRLEALLVRVPPKAGTSDHLRGEMDALYSLLAYFAGDTESTIAWAQSSLERTQPDLWIVRTLARLTLAGALQMRGDLRPAYDAVYSGFAEEEISSNALKATVLLTACIIHWLAADLQGLAQAAGQCIALGQGADSPEIPSYGRYHLGCVRYHQNDLGGAERHLSTICQQPYLNYGDCYVYAACGLALTNQAQGHPDKARAVAESAIAFTLETGNTTLLPVAQAFQAEIALKQGNTAVASQWAAQLASVPSLSPIYGFFSPQLTLAKVWLAEDTPTSRRQAAGLLQHVREFLESTHNTRFLIEALALQALLHDTEGDETSARGDLKRAIVLAEPGGFIRLFVDLGLSMARLLAKLHRHGVAVDYITQILSAFEPTGDGPSAAVGPSAFIEPLTPRELEVLALLAQHLTNKEIAARLVVSHGTVKTHILHVYRKLDVRKRREAVARAKALNLL